MMKYESTIQTVYGSHHPRIHSHHGGIHPLRGLDFVYLMDEVICRKQIKEKVKNHYIYSTTIYS